MLGGDAGTIKNYEKTKHQRPKTLFSLPAVSRPVPATKWMGMESSFAYGMPMYASTQDRQAAPKGKPRADLHDKEKAMHASPLPGRIVKEAQG